MRHLRPSNHPAGEANITRGCGRFGIIQMVSHYASVSRPELMAARVSPSQPLFFQLYPDREKSRSEAVLREVEALGFSAVFMTVDGPVNGNRERDLRAPFELEEQERLVEEARRASGRPGESGELPERPEDADNKLVEGELVLVGTSGGLRTTAELDMSWTDVSGPGVLDCVFADVVVDSALAAKDDEAPYCPERYVSSWRALRPLMLCYRHSVRCGRRPGCRSGSAWHLVVEPWW